MSIRIFTIGFAETSAESFFTLLEKAGVRRVVDVRLNNTSQLAAFSKKDDLRFFLRRIGKIDYVHLPELAPTQDILDAFKKNKGPWGEYVVAFNQLIKSRRIEKTVDPAILNEGCLLCSEKKAEHCHRWLVAEYLKRHWERVEIVHLG